MPERLIDHWQATVAAAPDAIALIDAPSGRAWTRAQLDAEAEQWRSSQPAQLGERLVVFAETNGPAWLRIFLGVLKAGAIAVPLDPGEPMATQHELAVRIGATWRWHAGSLTPVGAGPRRFRDGRRLVKLTSGSTGAPRALCFTDEQMVADGRQVCAAMGIRPDDLNLGLIPWGHSYGLGNLIVPLLIQGTAVLAGVAPLPHAIAEAAARFKPTVFPAVPALLRALADSTVEPSALGGLRTVISAGAPLAPEIASAFSTKFGHRIHSFYGSSETGGISYDPTGESAETGRGLGWPLPGVTLQFGRGGRFAVSSPAVFTIHNRRRGAHRMPDIGRLTPSGELVLLGRAGRFVKIAGRRLNLAELEKAIREVPGVRDAYVIPHPGRPDALAAAVSGGISAAQLRDTLSSRLASWKIPRKWIVLPEFPLTARGKTDTRQLRERLQRDEGPPAASVSAS